jgi:hypothetical protein
MFVLTNIVKYNDSFSIVKNSLHIFINNFQYGKPKCFNIALLDLFKSVSLPEIADIISLLSFCKYINYSF